ncbi:uncharacterized protein BBA_00940 [Beauveria bassiana ARSEF 2860]|uniref:Uncharacterized protein n=1 Tax=Beauveria bassiana (strain ARSEF 2860) TaxID=655819 RepID=J5K7H3_BEAB2|nr:uncharacterized protein BBA_00940 [Beauveria bassiana ARSEF 2860]EJP70071.1 hypothetical protein BBA_00940 [Beauveria bassiana ARSEF 2860]
MSGKLQSGAVSPTPSYEGDDMPSNDTEYQPDKDSVNLVTTSRSDQMAPRTRSQSSKSAKGCGPPLSRSDSTTPVAAASSPSNAKRCDEDNQLPIKKRLIKCVKNDSAHGIQYLHDRFRQEREYIDNRLTEEREKLHEEIDILKMEMLEGAKREKSAAEKVTDDTIKSKWNALRYNIRSVVLMLRSCEPKGAKDTPEILRLGIPEAEFKDLPQEYLREIFEGYLELYIWEFIYYHVFLGQGRQWRGNIFKLFQMARQEAISTEKDPKKIAEFALWLSQGGEASTSQLDKELQQPMADEFAESIFAMFQSQPKTIHQNDIKEVLGVAVYDATELAIMFMSSKALLLPAWPFHRPVENDWPTTDFENERLPNVKSNDRFLVFRPALLKFGNADGENHDVHVILCKPARLYF